MAEQRERVRVNKWQEKRDRSFQKYWEHFTEIKQMKTVKCRLRSTAVISRQHNGDAQAS